MPRAHVFPARRDCREGLRCAPLRAGAASRLPRRASRPSQSARAAYSRRRSWRWALRALSIEERRTPRGPDASPTGLVSSSRSRLRTHLDVAQRSNCPSKIKNQFGYHAQDRRARREGRRRNEVPIDSGAPPSALQPATTRRSNSVGRWPRSGAGAEAENTRSCQGAGRFWNEDRLPPAEPGR